MEANIVTLRDVPSDILGYSRDIFVYVPPSYYTNPDLRYPVVYAQDGQHIFKADSQGESWDLQHTADRLISEEWLQEVIIVGVSSIARKRAAEYFHPKDGIGELYRMELHGDLYEKFLIEEVKPRIDREFRTMPGREHSAILGSSAGGLVSYHIGFRRPDVFSRIGILSPFFVHVNVNEMSSREADWTELKLYNECNQKPDVRVWLDMGGAEGTILTRHAREVADRMITSGFTPGNDLIFLHDPQAGHTQFDWGKRVSATLLYFFGRRGTPRSLEIIGRKTVGVNERGVRLYANVTYDSGFRMSLLDAAYSVDRPERLSIYEDGTLLPKDEGTAKVTVQYGGLEASCELQIVPFLAEMVELEVKVEVPGNTPSDASIHAGFPLPKVEEGLYRGRFRLPRDLIFDVKVSRGFGSNEKRASNRRFATTHDQKLHFVVKEWEEQ
ncbi:alpha/beta hydrolase [Paenibacillus sp. SI8]|uniref:alpha/beta hydrolase n=1 Tax=unclassified Paenibacillus TaxID=185978 RepID=UPI003466C3DE